MPTTRTRPQYLRNELPLTFEKGLNEYFEETSTPEGYAAELQNWIPEPNGSLRVPRGWLSASTTGVSGATSVRGLGTFVTAAGVPHFYVGKASTATQYKIWHIAKSAISNGTWTNSDQVTANPSTRPLAMANGAGYLLYCTPEFPSANIRRYGATGPEIASADAIAGRYLVYHNNRFFTGGELANPTFHRWSELGDSATWNVDTNYQPLGQDDGEPIEDAATWDRNLIIGKEHSMWYQTGFGPDTFAWHRIDGGGVAPGRTIVPTPKGVLAIGRERVWYFTGGGFEPISRPIENSYGMTGNYMSAAYIDGRVYICDEGSGKIWCWDTDSGAWHTEVYDDTDEGPCVIGSFGEYLIAGTKAPTTNSIILYRKEPGTARALNAGDSQTFVAKTPQMWLAGVSHSLTGLHLHLRIRQRGGTDIQEPLQIKYLADGELRSQKEFAPQDTAGVYRERYDFGVAARYSHQFEFSYTVPATDADLFDIEEAILEYQVEDRR